MTAKQEADRLFPVLLERTQSLQKQFGGVSTIPISTYETDEDLAVLRPEDRGAWSAEFHRQIMQIIATRLRLRGFKVKLTRLDAASYRRWLAETKQKNTPGNRAHFISLQNQ